jgi:hypothetical protein
VERERGKKGLEGHKRREREETGGKWLEGGWGEGCAHRYRGIDAPVRCHSKYIQQLFWDRIDPIAGPAV